VGIIVFPPNLSVFVAPLYSDGVGTKNNKITFLSLFQKTWRARMLSEVTDYMRDGSRFPAEPGNFVLATISISNRLPTQRVGIKR
jgi:hypothetical protein